MIKYVVYMIGFLCLWITVGCAGILVPRMNGDSLSIEVGEDKKLNCIKNSVFKTDYFSLGSGGEEILSKSSALGKAISDELEPIIDQNASCSSYRNLEVIVGNSAPDESKVLLLFNAITFGVIPYWDQFYNSVEISIFESDHSIKKVKSQIPYMRYQSILLWPLVPFYETGTNDLDLRLIHLHFTKLKESISKGAYDVNKAPDVE